MRNALFVQFAPRRALRAACVLASNPDDLPQVFTVVEALSIDTLPRVARRMARSDGGRRLLATHPCIADLLAERGTLARLPEGSLGRAYLAFVERENISAEGIRAADHESVTSPIPPPLDWVHTRMRDTHDLWHVVVGYSGDILGEAALLAFTFAQTWNPAFGFLVAIALFSRGAVRRTGSPARRTIFDGFRRGLRAAWLPEQEWEALLELPLHEVRRRLRLEDPPVYREIRSAGGMRNNID